MLKAVIFDLDDTVYSWVRSVVPAIQSMVDKLVKVTGVDRNTLIKEIREENRRYGHTENPANWICLPCIKEKYADETIRNKLRDILEQFRSEVTENLRASKGVYALIKNLKQLGILVIGCSASKEDDVVYKLHELELLELFDRIYVSETSAGGTTVVIRQLDFKKPNEAVLHQILSEVRLEKEEVVYIGDSITSDMLMCKLYGISCIHYTGKDRHHEELYEQLKEVSSWTPLDFILEEERRNTWEKAGFKADLETNDFDECYKFLSIKYGLRAIEQVQLNIYMDVLSKAQRMCRGKKMNLSELINSLIEKEAKAFFIE